jgi:hypothetical protein
VPQAKQVTLQTHGHDKYGRTLADVALSDGMNLNQELVKQAGAGGTGSMRRGILCWKGWRRKHEKQRKVCGLIRHQFHRGSIAKLDADKLSISQM